MNYKQHDGPTAWCVQALLLGFFLLLSTLGISVRAVGLSEPDTCFLLALGRFIVENGHVPASDPFSWTYALYPSSTHYVVYQWLTEVIFYLAVRGLGLLGLIGLGALLLSLAFVILPQRYISLHGGGRLQALLLASLTILSALSHINLRPELFSYVLLALYAYLLMSADKLDRRSWKLAVILAVLMILWCNLHSGFVLGLLLLVFWSIFACLQKSNRTCLLALPLCTTATLINPAGWNLWLYLPYLFFAPINKTIHELRPFSLGQFVDPLFLPFLLMILLLVIAGWQRLRQGSIKTLMDKYFILGLLAMAMALSAYRMITFSTILLAASLAPIISGWWISESHSWWWALQKRLTKWLDQQRILWTSLCLGIPLVAATFISWQLPPHMPQASKAFQPPLPAIEFLRAHPQGGRLLNDPFFGDVMMWHMSPCPSLYVDTRYDIYGPTVMSRYWEMIRCQGDWQRHLKDLDISWIFLPHDTKLVDALSKQPDWQILFHDPTAVILRRKL